MQSKEGFVMNFILQMFRGFCMALADSVPGVSGGTIAFILGFYDKFILALDHLIYGKKDEKKEAFFFLIKLGLGWIIGMILAILVLTNLFQTHIYEVSSLFLGFILFSIPLIVKDEKENILGKYKNVFFLLLGIAIVVLITYFNPVSGNGSSIDIMHMTFGLGIYVFVAGMISISAMILPGVSGSTLLLIFGLYIPIISAIKEFLHFHLHYFPVLCVFGIGVLFGVLLVIKLIKLALEKHRSATIYAILGLMIGSFYAIIMGPTTLEVYHAPLDFQTFSILWFLLGGIIIFGLEKLKVLLEKKQS